MKDDHEKREVLNVIFGPFAERAGKVKEKTKQIITDIAGKVKEKAKQIITDIAKGLLGEKAEAPDPCQERETQKIRIHELYERESSLCSEILKLANGETGLIHLCQDYMDEEMFELKRQRLSECLKDYEEVVNDFTEMSEKVGTMPFRIQLSDDERKRYRDLAESHIKS